MRSALLFIVAVLYSAFAAAQYEIPAGELSSGTHNDVSDPLGTSVLGINWRKGNVRYNHTNSKFTVNNGAGWLTQFNDGPTPTPWGITNTNTDYFSFQGTNEIAGTEGIIAFDTVHFDIGAGNTMNITNVRQGTLSQYGEVSGGILVGRVLYFENGITTTKRSFPVNGAIVFANSAFYNGGLTDGQHVDGFVSEVNYQDGDNIPMGHGGDFTFPVGNGSEVFQLRRQGTFDEDAYLVTVGWVDGDPNTTNDPTQKVKNPTGPAFLGTGIQAIVPVGFWDWHVQDGTNSDPESSPRNGAESLPAAQTITVSIPELTGIISGVNASDLRLVGYDPASAEWKNLGSAGASGLTKGSLLSGTIPGGTLITAVGIGSIQNIILPASFLSFTVDKSKNCEALLEWQTGAETNNSHFVVERSANGVTFNAIGQIAASGNSNTTRTYQFTDKAPLAGINYYRISQVDFDGKHSESEIKNIRMNCGSEISLKVFPNPARSIIYIQKGNKAVSQINVIASNGQTVMKYVPLQNQGSTIPLAIQQIQNGIYLLQIVNKDGTTEVVKLLKQ